MLADQIKKRMFDAMKRRDEIEKEVLRVALGDIQSEGARARHDLSDDEALKVLKKVLKGIDETLSLTRDEDAKIKLLREKQIIESFLPQTLSVDQIIECLADAAEPIRSAANDGQATGIAMKHLKTAGHIVDGKDVAAAVKRLRA